MSSIAKRVAQSLSSTVGTKPEDLILHIVYWPTRHAEMGDVYNGGTSLENLLLQGGGGLRAEDIQGVYPNAKLATMAAKELLAQKESSPQYGKYD